MAGINDIFSDGFNQEAILGEFAKIADVITESKARCLITLPVKPSNREKANAVSSLNGNLKSQLEDSACTVIDLNPHLAASGTLDSSFTTDGVHLNAKAYEIWAKLLKGRL